MAEKAAESGEGMMVENENSELAVVLIIVTRAIVGVTIAAVWLASQH